jgi:tetratricopeptide (TPR) repeat protein
MDPDNLSFAGTLSNLAEFYKGQSRYVEAELLYKKSLAIWEKVRPDDPNFTLALTNLAFLYENQGRYSDAEPLFKRSLSIKERSYGPNHPAFAESLPPLAPAVCCANFDLAAFHSGKPDFQFRDNLTLPRMPSRKAVVVASVDPKLRRLTVNLSLRRNRRFASQTGA